MNITQRFSKQHEEIVSLCQRLQEYAHKKDSKHDVISMHTLQESLNKALLEHLLLEDSALYPSLFESKNHEIRETSLRLKEEVQVCGDLHAAYQKKYPDIDTIKENMEAYQEDTFTITEVILERIQKEDTELYPLLK